MIKDHPLVISEASGTAHKLRQQIKDREQNEEKGRDSNISNDQVPHLDYGFRFSFQGRTLPQQEENTKTLERKAGLLITWPSLSPQNKKEESQRQGHVTMPI